MNIAKKVKEIPRNLKMNDGNGCDALLIISIVQIQESVASDDDLAFRLVSTEFFYFTLLCGLKVTGRYLHSCLLVRKTDEEENCHKSKIPQVTNVLTYLIQ